MERAWLGSGTSLAGPAEGKERPLELVTSPIQYSSLEMSRVPFVQTHQLKSHDRENDIKYLLKGKCCYYPTFYERGK